MFPSRTGVDQQHPGRVLDNFVVLEGLDGSGTTTLLALLERKLSGAGVPHFCTSEPTSGPVGTVIRRILKQTVQADPKTIALLFAADRTEHLYQQEDGILSQLDAGRVVITDRYLFSSLAYQSLGCGFAFVHQLNVTFPLPRHLIFLDTPVDVSQGRLERRAGSNKELFDTAAIQADIRANYRQSFARFKKTAMQVHTLDGDGTPEQIADNCWNIIRSLPILTM